MSRARNIKPLTRAQQALRVATYDELALQAYLRKKERVQKRAAYARVLELNQLWAVLCHISRSYYE